MKLFRIEFLSKFRRMLIKMLSVIIIYFVFKIVLISLEEIVFKIDIINFLLK